MENKMENKVIEWLTEKENPSVRYYVMTQLVKTDQREIVSAKDEIMKDEVIQTILSKQHPDGYWELPEKFYTSKYKGTVWQLLILAELGADENNEQIRKACEFVLNHSQDAESFGFSVEMSKKTGHGVPGKVIPCLTGNMVYTLIRFGYLEDPRIEKAIDWIVKYQKIDDGISGIEIDKSDKYVHHEACFGKHSCFMGVVKSLKALSAIPLEKRSPAVANKIKELTEFLLIHHIFKKSHELQTASKQGWTRFGFPLMYQTDILEIMNIFSNLDIWDERMREAYEVIKNKETKNGTWLMENSFNGKTWKDIEKIKQPSKWITSKALKVILWKEGKNYL